MATTTPKQERSAQTRASILAAATACFAQNGFDATGVAEICQQAGISKGAFYHHFPSKQAVYLTLLEEWLAEFDQGVNAIRQQAKDVPGALRTMSATFAQIFEIASGQLPILFDFWAKASRDHEMWQATIAPFEHYYTLLTEMIEEGIQEGSLNEVAARPTALLLASVGIGALLQGLLSPETADWGRVGREGIDRILKTIERNV